MVPRFRPPLFAVNYWAVYLAGLKDFANFLFLGLVFWFRVRRGGSAAMARLWKSLEEWM